MASNLNQQQSLLGPSFILIPNNGTQKFTAGRVVLATLIKNVNKTTKSNENPATAVSEHNYSNCITDNQAESKNASFYNVYFCSECKRSYTSRSNLYLHAYSIHGSKKYNVTLKRKGIPIFSCQHCPLKFKKVYHLTRHRKKCHSDVLKYQPINRTCLLCNQKFNKKTIMEHFSKDHSLQIEIENLEFNNFETFIKWKVDIEKNSKCSFRKDRKSRHVCNTKYHYFSCNRSGHHISHSKGVRRQKYQGSCKIGGFCPASIRTIEHPDGTCSVYFIKTHIGHDISIEHLSLSLLESGKVHAKVVSAKLKALRKRHRMGDLLKAEIFKTETGWCVSCSEVDEVYIVQENVKDCNCKLICNRCETCVHHYKCSCVDSAIKFHMCKHIHSVCKFISAQSANVETNIDESTLDALEEHDGSDVNEDITNAVEQYNETIPFIQYLSKDVPQSDFDMKLEHLKTEYKQLLFSISNNQELEILQQYLTSINTTLDLLKSSEANLLVSSSNLSQSLQDGPSNENICHMSSYIPESKNLTEPTVTLTTDEIEWHVISEEIV